MKKSLIIILITAGMIASFLIGWLVFPKVLNKILKPKPAAAQEPYVPAGADTFGSPVYEDDSVIYYFYKDHCPWCRRVEPLTAGLPEQITLPEGRRSNVRLFCLNKVEDRFLQIITEYYEQHGITEERQYVPAIVIGGRYLFGETEIVEQMMDSLIAGEGLQTPLLDGSERKAVQHE